MTVTQTPCSTQWVLSSQLSALFKKLLPSPTPDSNVLLLCCPQLDFIKELLNAGVNVHIVDGNKTTGETVIEFFKQGPYALIASKDEPATYYSADKKLNLHNVHFRSFYAGNTKYNAIMDVGLVSTLPNPEARRAFGDKLIAMAAEKSHMSVFNVERLNGVQAGTIKELTVLDLNLTYGRGFYITFHSEVDNPAGYKEQLYMAEKTAVGGEFYDEKYSKGYSPWHMDAVNYNLLNHYHRIQPAGEPLRKILVPMSGKTVDIKWLADKGHEVVAVEISQAACREIFTRDQIPFEELPCPQVDGKLFKSLNGKIRAYCCDIFKFTAEVEGQFESVWERGAVIAFEEHLRKRYFEHVKTLVTKGCSWMSSIFQYDKNVYYNHPYCVNDDEVYATFEKGFRIESVDETVFPADREYTEEEAKSVMVVLLRRAKLQSVTDRVYLYSKL